MSNTKQLPGTRSFSVVHIDTKMSVIRLERRNQKLRKLIPMMVLRLTLETLGRFTCDIAGIIADSVVAALSWLLAELVAGCATYAEAMYPMPAAMDERDSSLKHVAAERVSPPRVATRLRLVVVTGAAQDDDKPHDQLSPRQQASISNRLTLRDWNASRNIDTIHAGRAPAARRKNGPR